MKEAPAPSGLSDADKEQYQQQIDEFVVPIEERALDAYENGWKKAIELGIYNQWTAKMREALGRLNAELYPPFKEIGFEVRSQGNMPLPPLIDSTRRAGEKATLATPAAQPTPAKKDEAPKKEEAKPAASSSPGNALIPDSEAPASAEEPPAKKPPAKPTAKPAAKPVPKKK